MHPSPTLSVIDSKFVGRHAVELVCCWGTVVSLAAAIGCGGNLERYRAGGTVVYSDGSPLPGGMVSFRLKDAPSPVVARGTVSASGQFELSVDQAGSGVPPGDYEVSVAPDVPDDRGSMTAAEFDRARRPIDARFRKYETSGLQFEVTDDEAKNDFRVQVERPRR